MPKVKFEQLPLVVLPAVHRAPRRGPVDWPTWKVAARCLTCPFVSEIRIQARDALAIAHPPMPAHRHRYACAAGPA
jgi:hypothetical protein